MKWFIIAIKYYTEHVDYYLTRQRNLADAITHINDEYGYNLQDHRTRRYVRSIQWWRIPRGHRVEGSIYYPERWIRGFKRYYKF